jgi:hypothetical protein
MTRLEDVAMQRGLVEAQRIDGAQPPLLQLGVRRKAAQKEIGQHEQQAQDDQRHSSGDAGHGGAPA